MGKQLYEVIAEKLTMKEKLAYGRQLQAKLVELKAETKMRQKIAIGREIQELLAIIKGEKAPPSAEAEDTDTSTVEAGEGQETLAALIRGDFDGLEADAYIEKLAQAYSEAGSIDPLKPPVIRYIKKAQERMLAAGATVSEGVLEKQMMRILEALGGTTKYESEQLFSDDDDDDDDDELTESAAEKNAFSYDNWRAYKEAFEAGDYDGKMLGKAEWDRIKIEQIVSEGVDEDDIEESKQSKSKDSFSKEKNNVDEDELDEFNDEEDDEIDESKKEAGAKTKYDNGEINRKEYLALKTKAKKLYDDGQITKSEMKAMCEGLEAIEAATVEESVPKNWRNWTPNERDNVSYWVKKGGKWTHYNDDWYSSAASHGKNPKAGKVFKTSNGTESMWLPIGIKPSQVGILAEGNVDEKFNAFINAAAEAKSAGKRSFKFKGKRYPELLDAEVTKSGKVKTKQDELGYKMKKVAGNALSKAKNFLMREAKEQQLIELYTEGLIDEGALEIMMEKLKNEPIQEMKMGKQNIIDTKTKRVVRKGLGFLEAAAYVEELEKQHPEDTGRWKMETDRSASTTAAAKREWNNHRRRGVLL